MRASTQKMTLLVAVLTGIVALTAAKPADPIGLLIVRGDDVPTDVVAKVSAAVKGELSGSFSSVVLHGEGEVEDGCATDESCLSAFASAHGYDQVLVGSVTSAGKTGHFQVKLQLFLTRSSSFSRTVEREFRGSPEALASGIPSLVAELHPTPEDGDGDEIVYKDMVEIDFEAEDAMDAPAGEMSVSGSASRGGEGRRADRSRDDDYDSISRGPSRPRGGKGKKASGLAYAPPMSSTPSPAEPGYIDDPDLNYWPGHNTEAYDNLVDNPFLAVDDNPLSTFSIDVDTASYSNMRRFVTSSSLPPADAVRIEEMVNYFSYDYALPNGNDPFSANVEVAGCPWAADHRLARIGIKGWELEADERPASNLTFLIDVSGSMSSANKLPLLKEAMKMLVQQLDERDRVSIAVYAGAAGLVLPPTPGDDHTAIMDAFDRLQSGGSTAGGAGIQLAYDTAAENFVEDGVNRVILATDGDFNVGTTNQGDLVRMIEEKAETGVFLTVLGFGMGNYKDSTLEKLADKGNGNYAYIDTINEAKKVLVNDMQGTLVTIAKDVKIQVEFNPSEVAAFRLIGYENRILAHEDFNDDTKDAGEIGAGHTVTALYEIVPVGVAVDLPDVDELRYQKPKAKSSAATSGEMMTLKLRYKKPDGDKSKLLTFHVRDDGTHYADASQDFKFAASVASFGMILRDSPHKGSASLAGVIELADEGAGEDRFGYRAEFIELVKRAKQLKPTS